VSAIPQDPTLQEVFDHVARHLLRQRSRSENYRNCALRSLDRRCAIGCLISDEAYFDSVCSNNGDESNALVREAVARSIGVDFLHPETVELLASLRWIHDGEAIRRWGHELLALAGKWGFDTSALSDAKAVR
jgi:hypothetical protein